jgi:hypothetical protein
VNSQKLKNNYKFFENKKCEFYPCHKIEKINCLFCFCPLYHINRCGGNFSLSEKGIKDCSNCLMPHSENGYEYILKKLKS